MRDIGILGCLFISLVTCGLTIQESQGDTVTFSDGDFAAWSFDELSSSGSSATALVDETHGTPLPSVMITTRTGAVAWGWAINEAVAWNPSIQEPISTVSLDIDIKSISGWGQGQNLCFIVEQEGMFYWGLPGTSSNTTGSSTAWHTVSRGPLSEGEFVYMTGPYSWDPDENPDFSSDGAPLRFGFAAGNASSGTYTQLYDNWSMSLEVLPIPEPSATMMLLGGGAVVLVVQGLRRRTHCL